MIPFISDAGAIVKFDTQTFTEPRYCDRKRVDTRGAPEKVDTIEDRESGPGEFGYLGWYAVGSVRYDARIRSVVSAAGRGSE